MFGNFGDTEATLMENGFFSWFQLERVDELAGAGEKVFRPRSVAFHTLVSLVSGADFDGDLSALSLSVARGFIDDPRQSPFARDIAKSFLETISQGTPAVRPLVDEIMFRAPRATMIVRGDIPSLPNRPSAGFRVFAGQLQSWFMNLPGLKLSFVNVGDVHFMIRAEPLSPPKPSRLRFLLGRSRQGGSKPQ